MAANGVEFVARWALDEAYVASELDRLRDLLRRAVAGPGRQLAVSGASVQRPEGHHRDSNAVMTQEVHSV